jgi:hypothetical protein
MGRKLILDIDIGNNGGFVVTRYKGEAPSAVQKLAGVKREVETLAFGDTKGLVDWISKWKDND